MKLVSTVWLEMIWNDSRLSWNPFEYDNITEITLPVSKLWVKIYFIISELLFFFKASFSFFQRKHLLNIKK